jgi:hypothetical protein
MGELAGGCHGVVTRRELAQAGVTGAEITHRVRTGALLREHRGVYRVGHRAPSLEARYLAAVRACGDGALLCGRAAAYLHGILKGKPPPPEVMAPTERRVPGVRTHRVRSIDDRDRALRRDVPVTTVARTITDLAAGLSLDELARACHEAGVQHRTTPRQVEAVLARRPNSPGAAKLRSVIRGETKVTLSGLERRFLALLKDAGLVCRTRIGSPGDGGSTAAGRTSSSRSNSTATATTTRVMPGSRTAAVSARPGPARTSSAATPTATCSSNRG